MDLASEMTVKPSFTALNYLFTASHAKSTCVDSCQSRSFTQGLRKELLIKKRRRERGKPWMSFAQREKQVKSDQFASVGCRECKQGK